MIFVLLRWIQVLTPQCFWYREQHQHVRVCYYGGDASICNIQQQRRCTCRERLQTKITWRAPAGRAHEVSHEHQVIDDYGVPWITGHEITLDGDRSFSLSASTWNAERKHGSIRRHDILIVFYSLILIFLSTN